MALHWFGDGNIHQMQWSPRARRKDSPVHAHTDSLSCITGDAPWAVTEGRLEMLMATWCAELTHWEIPWCWKRLKAVTEDEMVGWRHRFNGHEFEQTLGDGEAQGNLACCSPWGRKESDTTERLNNRKAKYMLISEMLKLKKNNAPSVLFLKQAKLLLPTDLRRRTHLKDEFSKLPCSSFHRSLFSYLVVFCISLNYNISHTQE